MKRLIVLLMLCIMVKCVEAQEKGIRFEQGLSWQEVQEKAKREHKYIFMDCYASWCGPCKKMDAETYPDEALGKFINQDFISVKVQMDTTNNDGEAIKEWYPAAHEMAVNYKVNSYPSLLFFGPDGKILHKEIGYEDATGFLQAAFAARDRDKQEYALLERYRQGKLNDSDIPVLMRLLKRSGEKEAAEQIAQEYIKDYLLKLPDELLYKSDNVRLTGSGIRSSGDPSFKLFYKNVERIDQLTQKDYAEGVITAVIIREEIDPKLWSDEKREHPLIENPDWQSIEEAVARKYSGYYAEQAITDPKASWYRQHRMWKEYFDLKTAVFKRNRNLFDSTGHIRKGREDFINNFTYEYVVKYATDKTTFTTFLAWQKEVLEIKPNEPDYIDTYAVLLYKMGRKKEAMEWEGKALGMKEEQFEKAKSSIERDTVMSAERKTQVIAAREKEVDVFKESLAKMKKGLLPWTDQSITN